MGNQNQKKPKPIAKFRAGAMTTSVWENKGKREGTDEEFTFMTIQLQRSYMNAQDEWVNETINLRKNDVANLNVVVSKAHEKVVLKEQGDDSPDEE